MAAINLDTAARLDITCRKGDTFQLELDFGETINTTEWLMHVRETDTSEEDLIIDEGAITFTVSDNSSGVTNAKLTITISDDNMANVQSGMYVYDIQNDFSDVTKTFLFGLFKVNEDITTSNE
tara:strand:+ start:108 stop:476 length:369 start_codon:yes stop_codon:yes gene_type:complete